MQPTETVSKSTAAPPGEREFEELTRITNELITTQRQLYKQSFELQRLNDEKNIAMGIVAHDLRNPLALVKMQSELLLTECGELLSADHREILKSISEQGALMLLIVNDLLDVSAIEAGSLQIRRETVDVVELVERVVKAQNLLAGPKSITIELDKAQGSLWASIDPPKFQQVLVNVIGNAVKFSAIASKVAVSVEVDGDELRVRVRDAGPGIPAEKLDTLFEPFETAGVNASGGERSTGLGLAIVRRIVEAHNGSMDVQSELGVGSIFSILMPIEIAKQSEIESKHAGQMLAGLDTICDYSRDPLRVLIVDDCSAAAKMTSRMLVKVCQSTIELAHDGIAALDVAKTFKPDLVLLDVELPRLDGRQVAIRLCEHFKTSAPLICALTAHSGQELKELANLKCFDSATAKPLALKVLRGFVEAAQRQRGKSGKHARI